ncbi:hypothetical protein A152_0003620 [Vibrio tasmaniensis 1F-187]|uniref:hypothetical protein n=1 Tax=Vibrio alginolyticus TaxID=663 RepID=UPI0002FE864A|nr:MULTISPECIES: hypothetical protein [Vibrio]NWK18176.1 hypothetical protein [Vibrio parahaemolyticus]OEF73034.1 hypothetical protein A152_11185 [Vibrio tasmaniensis 1F-187]ULF77384.1 hypothetical protein K6749_11730 [Vibrio alginolyticus]CAH6826938.1 conserved hypothetical protein [Vibrio chagasii]
MHNSDLNNLQRPVTSAEIETLLVDEFKSNKVVVPVEQPYTAMSLFIPQSDNNSEHTLTMTDWSQSDKVVIYKAVIAAYNYAFFDKEASISAKEIFSKGTRFFIEWLNEHSVENRYEILKRYESYRMDKLGNHGGNSPLNSVLTVLNYAIDSADFQVEVSSDDYGYITELRKTKVSPNLNKAQKSLASYFGELDWLRRDDIGVGKDVYSALASPRLTVESLRLTAATVILELKKYRIALSALIQKAQPNYPEWLCVDFSSLTKSKKQEYMGNFLYHTISSYHQNSDKSELSKCALEVLLLSRASSERAYFLLLETLVSQEACDAVFLNKAVKRHKVSSNVCRNNITANHGDCLFSLEMLHSLSRGEVKEITSVESMMFGWLMASLTVQPNDIPQLTSESFRKMRVGGRVTQIECEYFKGRARVFHITRSLSTRDIEGRALLSYLDIVGNKTKLYTQVEQIISRGIRSLTGKFRLLIQCDGMNTALRVSHSKKNTPFILPSVYCALIANGLHPENITVNPKKLSLDERIKLARKSESFCRKSLFGLQAIKNSAVHAFSDPYTYHYLVNRNSHTNQTEKINYLTEDNEEWINSAGRITREVMFDLIKNIFTLDFNQETAEKQKKEIAAFNSEFMAVSEVISYKSEEMSARLRIVTGQARGKLNEVGVFALNDKTDEPLDPIYVLDSPLTVLKMYNYLHEFKKNYKKLLATNPDLLFKTVMPTVEWIESTLRKMSKHSQQSGREQFDEMIKNGVVISVFHSL